MSTDTADHTDHPSHGGHGAPGYLDTKDAHLKRLRRIEGQVRGLQRLVNDDTYCIDVLTQVSAATRALESFALGLLEEHLSHCVAQALADRRRRGRREGQGGLGRHRPPGPVLTPNPLCTARRTTMSTTRYQVEGMTCEHCVTSVTEEVGALPGVTGVEVELVTGGRSTVTVEAAEPLTDEQVREAVAEAGYTLVGSSV